MLSALRNWQPGIVAKSWFVKALSLVALTSLALPALHLAEITTTASTYVSAVVLGGLTTAAELQVKLERHRRIVESTPAEVDRQTLESDQIAAGQLETEIVELAGTGHDMLGRLVVDRIPELKNYREQVFMFALNFAQEKATRASSEYAVAANALSDRISAYRREQGGLIKAWSVELADVAGTFKQWIWASIFATVIILGPVGMTIIHRMVSRLVEMRAVIMRLANRDASSDIPFVDDPDEVGDIARAVIVFRANAVALLKSESKLKDVNDQFDIALTNMSHGLCMFDRKQRVVVFNKRYLELYGLKAGEVTRGTTLRNIIELRIAGGLYAGGDAASYLLERLRPVTEASVVVHHMSDGRSISVSRQPMDNGGWVTIHEDVTEQQKSARHIAHMATHDALTGLANRALLREQLSRELARVVRGSSFALHYLDLDRFKAVNDSFGHPVGDALLRAVAVRLRETVRPFDTVARLGGDEFAVLQVNADTPDAATALATRLSSIISAPYDLDGHEIDIGTSVGIALAPRDSTDADELIKYADMALYRAKETARGSVSLYEPEIQDRFIARRDLERDLRAAVGADQFELYYQPVVDLATGRISSTEALIRWHHPERGMVPPLAFIPLAEETGLIVDIGRWVLREACREAVRWPTEISVAVNISPAQFKGGTVALGVIDALAESGLDPRRLTLEITESTLLQEDQAVLSILNRLRDLGIKVVLDDFGTGYSSMSYLRRFPFDGLKIDKSFIRDASARLDCVAIVQAIVSLATSLNMKTVAEGVETAADLDMVRRAGCTLMQGYLVSKPVAARDVAMQIAADSGAWAAVA